MTSTHEQECDELDAFEDAGTIEEFLAWVDAHPSWLSPLYENWLMRRDTVRQAAFHVMRRRALQEAAVGDLVVRQIKGALRKELESIAMDPHGDTALIPGIERSLQLIDRET